MAKLIPLTRGLFAIVDDEDYARVSVFCWHAKPKKLVSGRVYYYAARSSHVPLLRGAGSCKTVRMHHYILGLPSSVRLDHKSGDTLDNQRSNLRLATAAQNAHNSAKIPAKALIPTTSKYKGVRLHSNKKWEARITVAGKTLYLGLFGEEFNAAQAYNFAAEEHFEEFARYNIYDSQKEQ